MTSLPRLPVILLTGFLGAGKTTLLLRWLRESPMTGLRLGVVMNEFGAESVDSQLVDRPGLPLRQVEGGCVCCAPDNELGRACQQLIEAGSCDYLVIETSGLADPDNIIDVLTDHELLPAVQLHAVVTVLDAQWYAHPEVDASEQVLARKQLQYAHVVCLSRCDRLAPEAIERVEAAVRKINPRTRIVRLPFNLPDIGELLRGAPAAVEIPAEAIHRTPASIPSTHLHTQYESLTFRFPVPVERSRFEGFLSGLNGREVVRAKGFVRFRQTPDKLHVFQSVWGHHLIDEFANQPPPSSVAVFIGPNLNIERIQSALRELCFGRTPFALNTTAAPTP